MSASGPTVAAEGLSKSFGDERVINRLDLRIEHGSIVGLIGPSGCGKTTTVRLLTGLLEPTEGSATVFGRPAVHLTPQQRQRIGYLPQLPALFPELSLWENLSFHASMYGLRLRRRHRLHRVLSWVELDEDRKKKVREVSGGMQRRLALAAAFVHDPDLIFLDEPTAGIDPILRSKFWEQFRAMRDDGRTLCVTTQYVGEAAYCDYVGLLSDGELLMVDTPENLRKAAFNGEVLDIELARRIERDEFNALRDVPGVLGPPEEVSPRVWRLAVDDADAALPRVEETLRRVQLPVVEVSEHIVDFDEAFVRVIERHRSAVGADDEADERADGGVAAMSRAARRIQRQRRREIRRDRLSRADNLRASPAWATVVQAMAFVRKELAEILRQPRLLLLLVVGPFAILLLFGAGYRDTNLDLRTQFVGPEGSVYEDAVTDYADVLAKFIDDQGFVSDEAAAVQKLDDGELDVVVVFPADPLEDILAGDSADIEIVHRELDPFQQAAIEIAARMAVQEVNASVLSVLAGSAQEALAPVDELAAGLVERAGELTASAESSDPAAVQTAAAEAAERVLTVRLVIAGSRDVLDRLGGAEQAAAASEMLDRLDAAATEAAELDQATAADASARATELAATLEAVAADLPRLSTVDPDVLVRPFEAVTESRVAVAVEPTDFFAPSSIMLLLQHLALTFAALSLVRDREIGLLELLRVGPLSSLEILTGKTIAYLIVGAGVGALLIAGSVFALGVPFEGDVGWAAVAVVLVLLASLALGMVLSLISGSETQAVQYAMLSLLAGMFFSGFILDVDGLTEPYRYLSYLLPVTYGIRIMHDVMLRGVTPQSGDLVGLGALAVGYGLLAVLMLRRRLRTE